jgi:hypothetical protein
MKRTLISSLSLSLSLAAAVVAGGCLDMSGDDTATDDADQAPTISRTIVRLAEDGTRDITEEMISPAEQRQEIAARTARLASGTDVVAHAKLDQNIACDVAALWVFDGVDRGGNEICFIGSGEVNLAEFSRPPLCNLSTCWTRNWSQAVRSYWAGYQSGYFFFGNGPIVQAEHFVHNGPSTNAGQNAIQATGLHLN